MKMGTCLPSSLVEPWRKAARASAIPILHRLSSPWLKPESLMLFSSGVAPSFKRAVMMGGVKGHMRVVVSRYCILQ